MAPGGLLLEALDERGQRAPIEQAGVGALEERTHERAVAGDGAEIEERGGGGEIVLGERQSVVRVDHLVSNREPRVPQRIEERLDELRGGVPALRTGGDDDTHVCIAPERDGAATVTADRSEAEARRATDRRARGSEERAHEAVEHLPVPHAEALPVLARARWPTAGRDRSATGGDVERRRERVAMALKVRAQLSSERRCGANQRVRGDRHAPES